MKGLAAGVVIGAIGATALQTGWGAGGLSAPARAEIVGEAKACDAATERRNVAIVAGLKPRTPQFYATIAPGYVQHVPEYARFAAINGVDGAAAVKLMERYGFGATGHRLRPPEPGQPRDDFAYKVIAKCDFVVAVGEHWHPDPQTAGRFYPSYFFNMWRLENGRLVEHWDPDEMPSPLPDYLTTPVAQMPAARLAAAAAAAGPR